MLGLWKKPGMKFCPKCKSNNIEVKYLDMFGLQPKYRCRKCGFTSFILPEMRPGKPGVSKALESGLHLSAKEEN